MNFFPAESGNLAFVAINWTAAALMLVCLVTIFLRQRQSFVKPSLMIVVWYHLIAQWPFAVLSGFTQGFLGDPWSAAILIHGFVFGGLALSTLTWNRTALDVWRRIGTTSGVAMRKTQLPLVATAAFAFLLAGIYFIYVPLADTGLYALLTCPDLAVMARENSLKLLNAPLPKYALTILSNTAAPVFTILVVLSLIEQRALSWRWKSFWLAVLAIIWMLAFLNGAKAIITFLAFVVFASIGWQHRLRFNPAILSVGLVSMLLPAFVVFMVFAMAGNSACAVREETAVPPIAASAPVPRPDFFKEIGVQLQEVVLRSAVLPTAVGLWYVDYAQRDHEIGIAGIPVLARASNVAPIDMAGLIGRTYGPTYYGHAVVDSISATTGYLFAFYGYFGLWALPLAIAGLTICDLMLLALVRFPNQWLVPQLAFWSLAALKFSQSDYLTVWLTHGFGLSTIIIGGLILLQSLWDKAQLSNKTSGKDSTPP